jgi:hypothetical protein
MCLPPGLLRGWWRAAEGGVPGCVPSVSQRRLPGARTRPHPLTSTILNLWTLPAPLVSGCVCMLPCPPLSFPHAYLLHPVIPHCRPQAGLWICAGLGVCSLISMGVAIMGSALGLLTGMFFGASKASLFAGLWGYNSVLACIAVSAAPVMAAPPTDTGAPCGCVCRMAIEVSPHFHPLTLTRAHHTPLCPCSHPCMCGAHTWSEVYPRSAFLFASPPPPTHARTPVCPFVPLPPPPRSAATFSFCPPRRC